MVSFISGQFITRPDWGNCRGFLIPITGTCSKRPKSTLLLQEVLRGVFSPDAVPLCVQSPSGVDRGAFQVCIHYPDILRRSTAVLDNAHVRVELIDNVLSARAVCAGHISGICIPWNTGIVQYRTVNCSGGPDQGYVPGFSAFLPGLFSKQEQD